MGQIFNRIKRLINSYNSTGRKSYEIPDEDEELKKIIDELNNPKGRNNSSSEEYRVFVEEKKYPPEFTKACIVLGIKENLNAADIKEAYKKLIKENHPDKFSNENKSKIESAERHTREINEAYNIIRKYKNF